jgi:glutamate racemase
MSTIESGVYQSLIRKQNPNTAIFAKACPLFVPLIEEGFHNHPSALLVARSYLEPLRGQIDAALLACTHYPLIRPLLQNVLGPEVMLLEPAAMCAQQTQRFLSEAHWLNPQTKKPIYEFYVTDDPEKFRRLGKIFFGSDIEKVEKK